ncbi:hypothetical protein [Hymenobacter siberiensis]|uniref:hypothetical protein n=1 Tax=Hymenobacter siberiensis TaxID=2848396 RepID=UPI001C1E5F11|nr:hypothetical protein [Hymenobacter siberiensis]MBU6120731.1 hypothetical protein [Hymenobacter siberiensis]
MPRLLRLLVCLLALAEARPAAAQMRDAESATPRVPVSFADGPASIPVAAALSVAQYH